MILEEFDLKKQLALEHKEGYEAGLEAGLETGQERILSLTQKLIADSRIDDLAKASIDSEYLELLLNEYNLK